MPDYSKMTDSNLNWEAREARGYRNNPGSFDPAKRIEDAFNLAEFVRKDRHKWVCYQIVSPQDLAAPGEQDADTFDVMFCIDTEPYSHSDPCLAKALTVAALMAWEALQ